MGRSGEGALRLLASRRGWTDERELAHAIHGTIVSAAVMAAASLHGTLGQVVVSVVVTLVVYWSAERYANILASGVHGPAPTWSRVGRSLSQGWPMLEAAVVPLIVLVVATLATSDLETGVDVALLFAIVVLAVLGWSAARHARRTRAAALGWAVASGMLGAVVAALKLMLH
jgi:positive regulator of sigma E activity